MKDKQENEFSKTLNELEVKVQELNAQKKIKSRRLVKVQDFLEKKEAEKKKAMLEESEAAKSGAVKDQLGMILSIAAVLTMVLIPYYKKGPVDFWLNVIIGLCYLGFYMLYKSSK